MTDPEIEAMSFEDAMKELEATVGKLEHGEATLEQSIALYERGAKLRAHCDRRLREAVVAASSCGTPWFSGTSWIVTPTLPAGTQSAQSP